MVTFNNGYYHAMDREYSPVDNSELFASDVGESFMIKGDAVSSLNSRIFSGTTKAEIGLGKLGNFGQSVEEIGKEEREELRDLVKINDIELSTHADPNMIGFAGQTREGFDERTRKTYVDEVKKTIDFASEVSNKGAVVVHTGEWYRPISQFKEFEEYEGAKEKEIVTLVNKEDGKIIHLRKDMKFSVPIVENGEFIRNNGEFKLKEYTWKDAEKEAKKIGGDPAKLFYKKMIDSETNKIKGEARRLIAQADRYKKEMQNTLKAKNQIENELNRLNNDNNFARQQIQAIKNNNPSYANIPDNQILENLNKEMKQRLDEINSTLYIQKREVEGYNEQAINLQRQVEYQEKELKKLVPVNEFALEKTADSFSDLGIYAMKKSKGRKEKLYVSPENLDPDRGFGSHPDELREIILASRKKMANKLVKEYGYDKDRAKKEAEQHIKATFDIAHANIWRKYFKGSDKEFNKWVINQAKKLAKEGIIGHAHISDNLGFSDTHLSVGEGNTPVKEFIKELKKAGLNEFIAEAGGANFDSSRIKAWRHLGAKMSSGFGEYRGRGFDEVSESYFAQKASPKFIYGEYAPSNEFRGAPFYSGVPLD